MTPDLLAEWHFASASIVLGRDIYNARILAYPSDDDRTWESQSDEVKHQFITRAAEVLKTEMPVPQSVKPTRSKYYNVARRLEQESAARVLGFISPTAPWGVDTRD